MFHCVFLLILRYRKQNTSKNTLIIIILKDRLTIYNTYITGWTILKEIIINELIHNSKRKTKLFLFNIKVTYSRNSVDFIKRKTSSIRLCINHRGYLSFMKRKMVTLLFCVKNSQNIHCYISYTNISIPKLI